MILSNPSRLIACCVAIVTGAASRMFKHILSFTLIFNLVFASQNASACGAHNFYFDPDEHGVIGATFIKLAGLARPEPVFKVKHVPVAKVTLGVQSEITVDYKRPWFSSDVRMQLSSSAGVNLTDEIIDLDDYHGSVKVNFSLEKPGFNIIRMEVIGMHKGEEVVHSSAMYVQAKKSVTPVGTALTKSRNIASLEADNENTID